MGRLLTLCILIIAAIISWSWLAGGGWARIQANASALDNPIGDSLTAQKGKTVAYNLESLAPKIPQVTDASGETISSTNDAAASAERAKELGTPSPRQGTVIIEARPATPNAGAGGEYVSIRTNAGNTSPIDITGWAIVSAVSGAGMRIPQGVATYRMGAVPTAEDIYLAPGDEAVLVSGYSPEGVSFRTNACTGYLAQFQSFTPSLPDSCPSPQSQMPNTLANLQAYGASCIDLVARIPSCTYYLSQFPADISASCRSFVTNALSYNGCLDTNQWQPGFAGHAWRVYLGSGQPLWNPAHDVIRLLDASGRTVNVLSY